MSEELDLVLVSERVVTPTGVGPGMVGIRDGLIESVSPPDAVLGTRETRDLGAAALLPGVVDTHVHVNDPGTDWEGFDSAGRAAAAGGVTTIVDMPLNSIPVTTSVEALETKQRAAAGRCAVDYGFWGGVVPGNGGEVRPLIEAGALGLKCFLCPSGLEQFGHVSAEELELAMAEVAEADAVLLAHAEHPQVLEAARTADLQLRPRSYAAYLATRPVEAEVAAVELLVELAERTGCRVHVVHVGCVEAGEVIAAARGRWVPITAETCPHYLTFAAEEIGDGRCELKCAPPIRAAAQREALWALLAEGVLDLVASDHSPCPPALKHLAAGDLGRAWGGIASLQLALPAVWTGAVSRGASLGDLARWMALEPALLAGIDGAKGSIEPGRDADLVVLDPEASFTVESERLFHRHAVTPYAGMRLRGVVQQTFVRGRLVYDRPRILDDTAGAPVSQR